MTSHLPTALSVPIIVGIIVTLTGRTLLLNETTVDRLINRAIAAALVGMLLRESWFQHGLAWILPGDDDNVVNLARQVSHGPVLLIVSSLYGIAELWGGADTATAWRRQRRYDLFVVACTVILLIAGTPARRANLLIDQFLGWPAVVFLIVYCLPIAAAMTLLMRICIREMRQRDATRHERAVFAVIVLTGVGLCADMTFSVVEAVTCVLTEQPISDPEMRRDAVTFVAATVLLVGITVIPLAGALLVRLGWDRVSRYRRRLHPLWADLTAAVPQVVLDLPSGRGGEIDPAVLLHRMTMEIRDSLLDLERYTGAGEELRPAGGGAVDNARRIAAAIAAKAGGRTPRINRTSPRTEIRLGAHDLTAELMELLALADEWPRARSLLTTHDHSRLDRSVAR
ncbi:MAB_1171c family putative transporter [Nocardia rhizosphaerae]|uniref:MAB_1171c family putative transporter n=1 Tax=Nocardia rhizosphaerae TaxID=1691571 RepID=A0ABV8L768_9NOCA